MYFVTLIHTGEGSAPNCISESLDLEACYDSQLPIASDSDLAAACAGEEGALEACELTALPDGSDDPGEDKSCKLENFDRTRDRTHPSYNHQLAVRYAGCRDGLKAALEGLHWLGVPATVQFHGGFLENLQDEDQDPAGQWSFQTDLVDRGHEISLHWHTECDRSVASEDHCQDSDNIGPFTTTWGSAWGEATLGPEDSTAPSIQELSQARIDSALGVLERAAASAPTSALAQADVSTASGWGLPYRLAEDLRAGLSPSVAPAFTSLAAAGLSVITSGNDFPIEIEDECWDASPVTGPGGQTAMLRAPPHPLHLGNGLMFYDLPAPLWGQPGNDDPLAAGSEHQEVIAEVLACVEARLASAAAPATDVPPYDGQLFLTGGTAHLHNMIEGDPGTIGPAPKKWPAGVVELAAHRKAFENAAQAHAVAGGAKVTLHFVTLSDAEAARDPSADHDFELLLDE